MSSKQELVTFNLLANVRTFDDGSCWLFFRPNHDNKSEMKLEQCNVIQNEKGESILQMITFIYRPFSLTVDPRKVHMSNGNPFLFV